mmetsp:Transcript_40122/g.61294  ORF Transcript_40122/g.61294 Transcript_40122/m.61294 type:complete len:133 (+) Transcript_40122:352-750(+)|eukprot:CAMPEP_0170506854 /NCGR_PEP_ID=MMETSP0208-20121228/56533_1 /TAXON_ID=197538 /ORGANISM="Strombidium inclinatum, Strain S3" /LENGTH=132 /DNA_ID=CAMNT_0010788661 /DNA_START=339 /DNA_END=737 /DNA_ORIENTATION=-
MGNLFGDDDYGGEVEEAKVWFEPEEVADDLKPKLEEKPKIVLEIEEAEEKKEEEPVDLMGLFDDDYGEEIIPEVDEEVLNMPELPELSEEERQAKEEKDIALLIPYDLKNDYNVIYSMYAYNEEGHPYYTPF